MDETTLKKRRVQQILTKARASLLLQAPFYGSILLRLKLETAPCGTACTDMKRLLFDPEFVLRLEERPEELEFVMLHEALHCVLLHPVRGRGKIPLLYNLAADIVVNAEIMNMRWLEEYEVDGQQVVLTRDIPLNPVDEIMGVDNTPHGGRSVGYRSIKFYMDLQTTAAQSRSQSNDVPIFRYADVLLMKAEAILRGATATNGDTPMSLINQIRDYVGAEEKVTDSVTLDDLLDERGREFADESWRRNDLIRFGKFEDDWGWKHIINPAAKTQLYRRIFPIPTGVMNTNTNWEQNPGY